MSSCEAWEEGRRATRRVKQGQTKTEGWSPRTEGWLPRTEGGARQDTGGASWDGAGDWKETQSRLSIGAGARHVWLFVASRLMASLAGNLSEPPVHSGVTCDKEFMAAACIIT